MNYMDKRYLEVQYVNERRKKEFWNGLIFLTVTCGGFVLAVAAGCGILWVMQ